MILKRIGQSIPLLAVAFMFAAHAYAAPTQVFCTDNGDGTCNISSGDLPGSYSGVAYEGTYPDISTPLSHAGSYAPWAACSGGGCSFSGNVSFPTTAATFLQGWGSGTITTFWVRFAPGGNTGNDPDYTVPPGDTEKYLQIVSGTPYAGPCLDGDTRICDFTPEDGDELPAGEPVDFSVQAYVNSEDISSITNVVIKLHNIDQNVLLFGFASPSDIVLLNEDIDTAGQFNFSTTTFVGDGNYRIEASLRRKFFFDWITVPFSDVNQTLSHQFVVGSSTFIGNLTQNGFSILNGNLASSTATSSIALVARCNPLGSFDMTMCLSGLFIPDAGQIQNTMQGARDGILTRMPWGYITRFVNIVSSSATSTLPTWEVEVAMNTASDTTMISFDPGDMLAGAASLLDDVQDPYSHQNIREILEPLVQLAVGLGVILTIVADITGSHRHGGDSPADNKRRRQV